MPHLFGNVYAPDGSLIGDVLALLVDALPCGVQVGQSGFRAGPLLLRVAQRPQVYAVAVEHQLDALQRHLVQRQLQLFAFRGLRLSGGLGLLVLLEGIDDKLEIGHGIGRQRVLGHLMQLGPDTLHLDLGHHDLVVQQSHDVDVGLQLFHLQHRPLLAVLYAQPEEMGVQRQQVNADAVYLDLRLQLVSKHLRSLVQQLLLQPLRIQHCESCHQQHYYQPDQRCCYSY